MQRMVKENPSWGAPRIHGELLKLGLDVSERTVSRYLRRLSPAANAGKLWAAFLRNHREVIAAMDFFTVPTLSFRVLYCFFVIDHGRRKILHSNVTEHPTGHWIVQQLRETFREACPYRYVILDRDAKFGQGGNRSSHGQRREAHTHKLRESLAKWNCGTLGRKLPK
jgi:hypothetical protein